VPAVELSLKMTPFLFNRFANLPGWTQSTRGWLDIDSLKSPLRNGVKISKVMLVRSLWILGAETMFSVQVA
jgi:hypothetical protein